MERESCKSGGNIYEGSIQRSISLLNTSPSELVGVKVDTSRSRRSLASNTLSVYWKFTTVSSWSFEFLSLNGGFTPCRHLNKSIFRAKTYSRITYSVR